MLRLRVASLLTCCLLAVGCAEASESSESSTRPLTILHTNDLHARLLPDAKGRGGFAEVAAVIENACGRVEACLVLDAGDMVQGTPVSTLFEGVPIFEVANRMGFDAMTLGNHEFDYGSSKIAQFTDVAEFPVLNANLKHPDGGGLGDAPSIVLETENGIRVGIVGVVTGDLSRLVIPDKLQGWQASPVKDAVAAVVPQLAAESDVVVVLGHLNEREERELLAIPDVDFVVSGHNHSGFKQPVADDDTAVVRVRAYGHEIGRLDVQVDVELDEVVVWSWSKMWVRAAEVRPQAATREIVQAWEAKVSEQVDVPLVDVGHDYDRDEMRRLFERALKEETGADVAFINRGSIRDVFLEGPLLERAVWNAMPFDNRVVTGTIAGSRLPRNLRTERGLSVDETYRFASTDYVVAQWQTRDGPQLDVENGELLRDLLIRWIRKQGGLD